MCSKPNTSYSRIPTSIYAFFKITHQSEQLLLKQEVLLGNLVVKAKSLAVSILSNSSLKKITWAFFRFYLYFLFKINIFKMQLLKNDTANLVAFNSFWSHFTSSFRQSCPLWCVILKKINPQKIFGLLGRREKSSMYSLHCLALPLACIWFVNHNFLNILRQPLASKWNVLRSKIAQNLK